MATPVHRSRRRPTVVVVGQFRLLVEAVCRSLPPGMRAVPVAVECFPALSAAREHILRCKPDVVTLVVTPHDAFYAADLVTEIAEQIQEVVVVGKLGDPSMSVELFASGAAAVLDGDGVRSLVELIERPSGARSGTPRATRPARRLPDHVLSEERRIWRSLTRLTPAEARTLWQLMHGHSVGEIARLHSISVETVRSHIRSLLAKLQTSSQLSAVALAWRVDWRPTPAALVA